ncbi:MAG: Fe-S cluster assembly protein SufD [Bdellovibrionales bacterium]|nr:Fe-S cluster assembly protein SufD [Bdellovibrionales bacterium]
MTQQESETPWYESSFELLETLVGDDQSAEIEAIRTKAHQDFLKIGLPKSKTEDWKYTDIRELRTRQFSLADKGVVSQVDDAARKSKTIADISELSLQTVDGFVANNLDALRALLPKGVILSTLREAFANRDSGLLELYREHFGQIATTENDFVVAFNTSFFQDVLIVHVPAGAQVEQPLYIQHIASGLQQSTATFPRILCVVEAGAKLALVEHFATLTSEGGFTASVTELVVGDNAEVSHYQLGLESDDHIRISRLASKQGRDARVRFHSSTFGGQLVRNEVCPTLTGVNGFTGLYGISVLSGNQHVDNHTVLDHSVPHCESDERYKGIYDGKSEGVFCGTIIVREDAQKTNAIQNNAAVLLSDRATVNTKPQLKIWADDVKCTHGATVGQLDQVQLFYLRSRGIGEKDARNLLLRAFAGEVTQEIELDALRSAIEQMVVDKLSL